MPAQFYIDPNQVNMPAEEGTFTVELHNLGPNPWSATTVEDWILISPASGVGGNENQTEITLLDNDGAERTGTVSFETEVGSSAILTIVQEAASAPSGGNIFVGGEGISIMLGGDEIPAIYCGEELLYPINLGTLTGISITNLTWVTDVPYTGGTATKDNCTYKVIGHYDSGKDKTITSQATITGSIVASSTTSTTRTDLGLLVLTATYEGFTASGSVEAYQEANHYNEYLTFIITSPGRVAWYCSNASSTYFKTIQYSLDSGATWTSITSANNTSNGFDVVAGDVVMFKGTNTHLSGRVNSSTNYYSQFTNTTAGYVVEGNIMSLLYGDDFAGNDTLPVTASGYTFGGLFNGCTGMSDASNLILPADVLQPYCYRNLFAGCRLTTGVPKLPAMTLAEGCYTNMFINCYPLETAPDLPARTLVTQCYDGMLYMQSAAYNLRYIKCLATNMTASNCLRNFKNSNYISSTGVFVKYPGASWASGGNTGIPTGWTVIESTE